MERIALAREYRVAEWLRDAIFELIQKSPSEFEELLWPANPYSNSLDGNWEATSREWETLARIFYLQTKVAAAIISRSVSGARYFCSQFKCDNYVDGSSLCKCRLLPMVDEAFRGEFENLKENPEHVEHPLPCKFPISYLCALKIIFIANSTSSPNLSAELELSISVSKKKKKKGKF